MTYIHSLRLTGETTETHAWHGRVLCGYVWDAGIVPSGKIPVLLTFLPLCMSRSVLDPVAIWGWGREAACAEPQVVQGFAKLLISS